MNKERKKEQKKVLSDHLISVRHKWSVSAFCRHAQLIAMAINGVDMDTKACWGRGQWMICVLCLLDTFFAFEVNTDKKLNVSDGRTSFSRRK